MRNNKAAIELSMTTIVVVVLSLTLLIMGFVLVRSIMCSAIGLTDTIGQLNIIYCGVKAPKEAKYKFDIEPKYGLKNSIEESLLKEWVESYDFNELISPSDREVKKIGAVDIPDDAPEGNIIFTIKAYKDNDLISTKTLNFKVARQGFIQSAMC